MSRLFLHTWIKRINYMDFHLDRFLDFPLLSDGSGQNSSGSRVLFPFWTEFHTFHY